MLSFLRQSLVFFLLLILICIMGAFFFRYAQQMPSISDTIGYVYAAEQLASGHGLVFEDSNNDEVAPFFSLFAFQIRRDNSPHLYLGFPPGFPLLLALGILLTGSLNAVHYVVPFLSVVGLITTFYLGQVISGGNRWVGLWAAFIVAVLPTYWEFGTSAWSEVPSMVMVTGGYMFYLLSQQAKRPLIQKIVLSLLGGVLLIGSLFIRYANITFLVTIGLYELSTARSKMWHDKWRWPFYSIVGLGLIGILFFNHFYYGGIQLTSYSPENGWYEFPPFSLNYALGPERYSLIEIIKTLWHNFSILLLLVPGGCWLWKKSHRWLVITAIVSTLGLYSIYAFEATGPNARFIVPAFPLIAIAIAQVIVTVRFPNPQWSWLGMLLLILLLGWPTIAQLRHLQSRDLQTSGMVNFIQEIVAPTTQDSVFLSYTLNDALIYYGQRSVLNYRRIPQYDPELNEYNYKMFEPCLRYIVDQLLTQEKSVFYIHDQEKPLYNSLVILQQYYDLVPVFEQPPTVYQIMFKKGEQMNYLDRSVCSI